METIHVKTVDPISQDLLRAAEQKGIRLNWERYEKLQPQDGFLRLGLSCPYGCLQGPCRIDPFGRGPDQGLCGLDRDGMVAAFLLRLVLQGTLELAGGSHPEHAVSSRRLTESAFENVGGSPLSADDIFISAAMLARPLQSAEDIIRQALRLSLFAADLPAGRSSASQHLSCRCGYGLMADNPVVVGLSGQVAPQSVASLIQAAAGQTDVTFRILSLGDWIPVDDGYLPLACTSGEAELLISTGHIGTILCGPGADPAIPKICQTLHVPVVSATDAVDPKEILQGAKMYQSRHPQADFSPDASLVNDAPIRCGVDELRALFDKAGDRRLAIIGGSDMPQQPHGHMPVELAKALKADNTLTVAWGDAALWMLKDGLCSEAQEMPAIVLEPRNGLLQAVDALQQIDRPHRLAGICFSGLKYCSDLSIALGLAAMGLRVAIAAPIPLWGGEGARRLLSEQLAACGGELTHFDHPAQTEEMLEWFKK